MFGSKALEVCELPTCADTDVKFACASEKTNHLSITMILEVCAQDMDVPRSSFVCVFAS